MPGVGDSLRDMTLPRRNLDPVELAKALRNDRDDDLAKGVRVLAYLDKALNSGQNPLKDSDHS